jgi:spermidine/putrescine-binding protein
VRFYWDDQSEAEQAIASGEVVVAYAWNAALKNLKDQGIPVAYANPKEGIWTWMCGIVRTTGGQGDVGLQHELIDAWLDAETGKWLIENYYYGHSNAKAFELADQQLLEELGWTSPDSLFDEGIFFEPYDPQVEERYTELFEEIKAGF